MKQIWILSFSAIGLFASCAGDTDTPSPAVARVSDVPVAAPGWVHPLAKSKFHLGTFLMEDRSLAPRVRHVGSDGVFTENPVTGATMAISDADSPLLAEPPIEDSAVVLAMVESYFRQSGIPQDQIRGGIYLTSIVKVGSDASSSSGIISREFIGNASRIVDGAFDVGGFAYASFKPSGQTWQEGVYWPEVPASAIADARALRDVLADPVTRAAYLEKIEAAVPGAGSLPGTLHIHHSSYYADMLRFLVTYNVSTGPHVYHFDGEGRKVDLP